MKISEHFYSVQCEGVTNGVPAYFIRLPGCNLCCGGTCGSLMQAGKATWWCDSEALWKQSKEVSSADLVKEWKRLKIYDDIMNGIIHVVWTGGEPALPANVEHFDQFRNDIYADGNMYIELETNGTIDNPDFYDWFNQINCSPKLSNSGMPKKIRINDDAIDQIAGHTNSWFKFVVNTEADVKEAIKDYIEPFDLYEKTILMPGCDSRKDLAETTAFVVEMSKKYRLRASTRMQILVWDKRSGV